MLTTDKNVKMRTEEKDASWVDDLMLMAEEERLYNALPEQGYLLFLKNHTRSEINVVEVLRVQGARYLGQQPSEHDSDNKFLTLKVEKEEDAESQGEKIKRTLYNRDGQAVISSRTVIPAEIPKRLSDEAKKQKVVFGDNWFNELGSKYQADFFKAETTTEMPEQTVPIFTEKKGERQRVIAAFEVLRKSSVFNDVFEKVLAAKQEAGYLPNFAELSNAIHGFANAFAKDCPDSMAGSPLKDYPYLVEKSFALTRLTMSVLDYSMPEFEDYNKPDGVHISAEQVKAHFNDAKNRADMNDVFITLGVNKFYLSPNEVKEPETKERIDALAKGYGEAERPALKEKFLGALKAIYQETKLPAFFEALKKADNIDALPVEKDDHFPGYVVPMSRPAVGHVNAGGILIKELLSDLNMPGTIEEGLALSTREEGIILMSKKAYEASKA